jgi:adenylylsulfate kinase-like enzyme
MIRSNRGDTVALQQRGRPKRCRRVAKVASALAASACLAVPAVVAGPAAAQTSIKCYDFGDFTQCVCVTNGKGEWC